MNIKKNIKKERYLDADIKKVLGRKIILIGGPRQVGKTTLAQCLFSKNQNSKMSYYNWDNSLDKSEILKEKIDLTNKYIIFDEIHKYKNWRSLVKGYFDKFKEKNCFIVTGSARLDYFRRGGDSLLGRCRYFRLHPFTILEYKKSPSLNDLRTMLKFGGFPGPLFLKEESEHRIWQKDRMQKVIMEDLRDLENIKDISLLLLLAEVLPERVGSPLSLQSLAEDLSVSHPSIFRWITHLSHLYYCYLISPFGAPKIRAVKKLQKCYMWDWSQVPEEGPRFENLVASHLLKYCHYIEDTQGYLMELRYLRDTDGREIDFVVLKNKKPIFAVECKTGDRNLSPHIKYFKERTNIPEFYQVHLGTKNFGIPSFGQMLPFIDFCKLLKLV